MHSLAIESRLVSHDHSRKDRILVEVLTELLRAFVDAEIISDSMACSMSEIAFCTPQRHTGECVKVAACRSAREDAARELDHASEYESIILFLKVGADSHRNRPCDIRRAGQILSARIHKIKSMRTDHGRAGLGVE